MSKWTARVILWVIAAFNAFCFGIVAIFGEPNIMHFFALGLVTGIAATFDHLCKSWD